MVSGIIFLIHACGDDAMAVDSAVPLDTTHAVRAAFAELDLRQLGILARLSPTRRLEIMFDLCEFARQLVIASERQGNPGLSDKDLARRVRARIELAQDI
jgi:hypothetical protein